MLNGLTSRQNIKMDIAISIVIEMITLIIMINLILNMKS